MKKRLFSILTVCFVIMSLSLSAFAHGGRTDSSGGHKDNKNKSGLGSYHYHCGGYPAHLHPNGVCPYKSGGSSNSSSSSSSSSYTSVPKTVYATRVNVSNMPSSIDVGESVKLNGSAYPSNAEDKSISWESSDTSVAKVDSSGNLTAVGVGTVVISAKTSRGTTSKFNLKVNEVVAESISIEGKKEEITIEDTTLLSVVFLPENTTYKDYEWKSADESIVSVDENGKLTALAVGKTTISATHKELSDSFEIEVKPILAESIEISCVNENTGEEYEELRFEEGTVVALTALVLPDNTTDAKVLWKTDNSDVATINENGELAAVAEGTVTVTAETSNGLVDTVEIEIYKTSLIVNIIAGIIVFAMGVGVIGIPIFLFVFIKRKIKKNKSTGE